jgi:excisionase family DNA binding protein
MQNELLEKANYPLKRLLTVQEAIFGYGLGRSKFYQEVAAGRIRLRKCGRRTLVSADDMEAWAAGLPIVNRKSEAA